MTLRHVFGLRKHGKIPPPMCEIARMLRNEEVIRPRFIVSVPTKSSQVGFPAALQKPRDPSSASLQYHESGPNNNISQGKIYT